LVLHLYGKKKSSGRENKSQQETGCWIAGVTVINAIRHCTVDASGNGLHSSTASWAGLSTLSLAHPPSLRCDLRASTQQSRGSAQTTQSGNDWLTVTAGHLTSPSSPSPRTSCPVYMSVLPSRSILQRRAGSIS
jgi:hypothetical protein